MTLRKADRYISIHALLAESDTPRLARVVPTPIFLSTLSLRRATRSCQIVIIVIDNFYPRSPCGERRQVKQTYRVKISISIHALLAESDNLRVLDGSKSSIISIHALLAESDLPAL